MRTLSEGSSDGTWSKVPNSNSVNKICRDYLRGNCRRRSCRFPHVMSPDAIIFCHDFQNTNCIRPNCKFLHYTVQAEEYYRTHGEFPPDVGPSGISCDDLLPCNDHKIYGRCIHKDFHMIDVHSPNTQSQQLQESDKSRSNERYQRLSKHSVERCDYSDSFRPTYCGYRNDRDSVEFQSLKRSTIKIDSLDSSSPPLYKRYRDDFERIDVMAIIRRFEEEQVMLRRRVEANEIKIAELRASNEYLQLRLTNVQCSAVVNPVTVTQTSSQPQTQLIGGVSIAPVQMQATPIATQIIASSAAPLAIAANTSQGQPAHAQQILGTSQITLTPALAQGLTINTSQALAMSNSTPMMPIMTHSILPH